MNCWNCDSSNVEIIGTMGVFSNINMNSKIGEFNIYECLDCLSWFDDMDIEELFNVEER